MVDPAAPFSLGEGPDACLLLHGLTGAPSELRPVGEALAQAGIRAVGPLLPGHGTRARDLENISRVDLLDAARSALANLKDARRVFVCGLSMGALLTLRLAAEVPGRIDAVALLAPAIRFVGSTWLFTQVLGRLPITVPFLLPKGARDIQGAQAAPADDRSPSHPDGAYRSVPLRWGRELRKLADAPRVQARALILHGALDRTTDVRGARLLARAMKVNEMSLRVFPRSGHVLPLDLEGQEVSDAVVRFFKQSEG